MGDKPQQKDRSGPEARQSGDNRDKGTEQAPTFKSKPRWPKGLLLPPTKEVTCFIPEGLAVVLSRQAFEQLFGYAYSTTNEICCLGTVKQEGERFRVERFYLVPQSGSVGHTELDQEALAGLVEELLAQGKAEEAHSLKCWAHSHPGMDVFWSKTDEETCKRLVTDYLISLVVSDGFAVRCRVDVGGAIPFTIDHVPVLVDMPVQKSALRRYAEEVRAKVKQRPVRLSGRTAEVAQRKEAAGPEYCDACGSFHLPGRCPLADGPVDQEAWDEYVRQCRAAGLEPDVGEFEFLRFEEEDSPI